MSARAEDVGQREHRRELLEGLRGRVVEVGAGNGLNFPHYPPEVEEVVAVEPEPFLRERAVAAAAEAPVSVRVLDGVADRLALDDAAMDAAVVSLVLCSVPDQLDALAEVRRVLRPGGKLRFYEHVRSERAGFARAQRAADLVWPRIAGGCHTHRDHGGRHRGRRVRRRALPALLLSAVLGDRAGHAARARPGAAHLSRRRPRRRGSSSP
ncbi:MAG TPA: methyltransferase domain-containing protein, partial [Solirubrobacteraceae bacterium]|nr:methyltransferase domain-containing protein [Solirubrobacteraceae bacterium]